MKIAPLVVLGLLFCRSASAEPHRVTQEDGLADGELDPEDIATRGGLLGGAGSAVRRTEPRSHGGSAYVSLVGFDRRNAFYDAREQGGFLVVGLPFDRLARPSARATPPPLTLEQAVATAAPEVLELGAVPRLARSCVGAAWRIAGIGEDDDRLDGILARARWSAILPEARFRAVRFTDARLSLDTGTETSRTTDYAGANVGLEARLTWRFDRLIYADDEPAFERIRLEHHDARNRIAQKVLDALFHWQRAMLDLRTLPPGQQGTRDEADVVLRVLEAETALDVLTNGWFSTHKPRVKTAATGPVRPTGEL